MTTIEPPADWRLTPDRPPVVVAIAHWNRVDLLRACLDSLRAHTTYPYYRISVFDQGSTDGSADYLRGLLPEIDVVYVKRTVFDRCGSLERIYEEGYFEDVDLAFKARAAGFTIVYEPTCVIVHDEHGSFGAGLAGTLMRRNREILRSRWASCLAAQPASAFELTERGMRPRLLLVTGLVPGNTLSPRMRRIRQLIRRLNGTFEIAYLNPAAHGLDRYAAVVEELGATPFFPVMNGAAGVTGLDDAELLRVNYFPVALCGDADAAAFLRTRFPAVMLDATTVVVDVGMEVHVADAAARTSAGHFVVANDTQRREVLAAMPHARCASLPPRPEVTTSHDMAREARPDIVMLSDNADAPAAAAAVTALLAAIVPGLRSGQPHVRVRLGGGPVSPELLAAAPAALEVLPRSTPIGIVLDRARVVVVPQHWCGPDTISNIAEARARRIPIVTSPDVVRGAGLTDGVDAVAADTPEAFVEQIARIYADPWVWTALANGGGTASAAAADDDDLPRALAVWATGEALSVTGGR